MNPYLASVIIMRLSILILLILGVYIKIIPTHMKQHITYIS